MNLNFSENDLIFMYIHFKKEARKLTELKSNPKCPIAEENINADIQLYTSLADKLKDAYPKLAALDDYKI